MENHLWNVRQYWTEIEIELNSSKKNGTWWNDKISEVMPSRCCVLLPSPLTCHLSWNSIMEKAISSQNLTNTIVFFLRKMLCTSFLSLPTCSRTSSIETYKFARICELLMRSLNINFDVIFVFWRCYPRTVANDRSHLKRLENFIDQSFQTWQNLLY